jgi:hypothetical protein
MRYDVCEPNPDPLTALLLDSIVESAPEGDRAPPRPIVRANLLAAIGDGLAKHPFPGFLRRFAQLFKLSEAAAEEVLSRFEEPDAWLPLGSVSMHSFEPGPEWNGAYAALVRCAPGLPFPLHRHVGKETTLFLSGTVVDDDSGATHLPGDLVSRPAGTLHRLTVLLPRECVFAVLMEDGFPEFD